ncbi:ABC transporter substrate-binding protein [Hahella sp. CCB-MM4]|uniref:substrate-binding periplasmic protein n=1 Tax=Hahella sp. (strain CCB-MM4) TaxID=1926491 RepID=UPI00143D6EA2|nr:transporter substrate-binding domain-containing protein [Hahella sp. CCB-MM4]
MFSVHTEEFPPFNYTENGRIVGASTEIVEAIMRSSGYEYHLESHPWARAYELAKSGKNTLIYSIGRTPKREEDFKWIGILVPSVHSVFALKERSDIVINSLNDLSHYTIGTTINDVRESYLVSRGFDVRSLQRIGGESAYIMNYLKLMKGRIDLWPMPDAVMSYIVRKTGDDPETVVRKVYELSEISRGGYYLAAGRATSEDVVVRLQASLEVFRLTQDYQEIINRWGL